MLQSPTDNNDAYLHSGYVLIDGVFTQDECARLSEIYELYADRNYSAIMGLHHKIVVIEDFMRHPKMVEIVEGLQTAVAGQNVEVDATASNFFYKKAGTMYAKQAWNPHQDNSYHGTKPGVCVTTNVFLDDADVENGCMYIYPGSHKEPLLPFEPTLSYREETVANPGNRVEVPLQYVKTDLIIKKGSLLVMNNHIIHGSYPNISKDRYRRMFSVTYCNKGEDFAVGKNAKRQRINVH